MSFFPFRGPPWTPKPRKTRGFLIAPRWNSGTPRGPKHRKTRCFLTPWAEYTVNYKGSGDPEVSPRWRRAGRRQGRHATITFGYQPKASARARAGRRGRRPDLTAPPMPPTPEFAERKKEECYCMLFLRSRVSAIAYVQKTKDDVAKWAEKNARGVPLERC